MYDILHSMITKQRKKRSIIWSMPDEEFTSLVLQSSTLGAILFYFGLQNKGGNSRTLKTRIQELKIDISHITLGIGSNKGKTFNKAKLPLENFLTANSVYSRSNLKRRLIKENILNKECAICKLQSEWQNKPLVLILDHINGTSNDNRLENLRLLCPNCNSQTNTFAGRNLKSKVNYICSTCGGHKKFRNSKQCPKCHGLHRRKTERPNKQILIDDIESLGYVQTGKKYGVSDNAIRKWLTRLDSNEDS